MEFFFNFSLVGITHEEVNSWTWSEIQEKSVRAVLGFDWGELWYFQWAVWVLPHKLRGWEAKSVGGYWKVPNRWKSFAFSKTSNFAITVVGRFWSDKILNSVGVTRVFCCWGIILLALLDWTESLIQRKYVI